MSTRNEKDERGTDAPSIMSPERLAVIRTVLEQSPVIVEHWFFYGSRAPDRLVFDDREVFEEYLRTKTNPGDAIHVWRYDTLCRDDNSLTHGKCPAATDWCRGEGPIETKSEMTNNLRSQPSAFGLGG